MIRNFNIKVQQTYDGAESFEYVGDGDIAGELFERNPQENYIHPDSYEILQPREGDLIRKEFNDNQVAQFMFINSPQQLRALLKTEIPFKIIQRNGKAFFVPECEAG